MKFKYFITLKNGYMPTMKTEPENEIEIVIEAENRVTADRMIKALIEKENVIDYDGICIDE